MSKALTVSRVDEDIPTDQQSANRKPWFVALTQTGDAAKAASRVRGLPAGHSILLSEDEVLALVAYLFEPQTAVWAENSVPDADVPAAGNVGNL